MRKNSRFSLTCLMAAGVFAAIGCTVKPENDSPDGGSATGGTGGNSGTGGNAGTAGGGGSSGSGGADGGVEAGGTAGSGGSAGSAGAGTSGTSGAGGAGAGGTSGAGGGGAAGTGGRAGAGGSAGTTNDAGGAAGGGGADAGGVDGTPPVDGGGIPDQGPPGEAGSDPCTGADPGNEDRDHATPIPIGSDFQGCLQTQTDIDFYEFTTPDMPLAGGVAVVSLTEVSPAGGVDSTSYAASDNGAIENNYASGGASVFYWFATVPASKYRVDVKRFSGTPPTSYKLKVAYAPVNDTYEPNDLRTQAKPLSVATPLNGYFFAGYANSTGLAANAWEDWFKVTLADGSVTVALADLASDINGEVTLYDNLGVQIADAYQVTKGATVVLTKTGIVAGDYYVKLTPFSDPTPKGDGVVPGVYVTQPYTVTVTQP
jgi:hypothetical protein